MGWAELQQALIALLATRLEEALVTEAYPKGPHCPKERAVVTVGLGGLQVQGAAPCGTPGARQAKLTVQFTIYGQAAACYQAQEQLTNCLLFGQTSWEVAALHCGGLEYDGETRSLRLRASATLQLALLPEEGGGSQRFREIAVRRKPDER